MPEARRRAGVFNCRTVTNMNSAVAAVGGNVNGELVTLLSSFNSFPKIPVGVAACAGTEPARLGDTSNPILGYLIRPEEVFSAWLATPNGFHVFELNKAGDSLSVSVPWSRVARVVHSVEGNSSSIVVEIDGDRIAVFGAVRDGQLDGLLRPAGYATTANDEADGSQVAAFASLLRRLIA